MQPGTGVILSTEVALYYLISAVDPFSKDLHTNQNQQEGWHSGERHVRGQRLAVCGMRVWEMT